MINFGQSYDALTYDCAVWHVDDAIKGLHVEHHPIIYNDYIILFLSIDESIEF